MAGPKPQVETPSLARTLRQHSRRVGSVEAPVVGQWVYVLPIAPATAPDDLVPSDPLAPSFQNGTGNFAGQQAVSFRIHPATRVTMRGPIDLAGASLPVVVFTLPAQFRPSKAYATAFPSKNGDSMFTGRVDTNGDVSVVGEVPNGDGDIKYDFQNVGGYLQIETTGAAPTSEGILLHSVGDGNDIVLESEGGIYLNDVNGWNIVLQSFTGPGGSADIDLIAAQDIVLNAGRDVDVQAASFLNLASLDTADLGASIQLQLSSDDINVQAGSVGWYLQSTGGILDEDNSSDGIYLHETFGSGGVTIEDGGSGGVTIDSSGSGDFRLNNLGSGQMILFDSSGNDMQLTADTTAAGSIALAARGTGAEIRTTSYHAHFKAEDTTAGMIAMWVEANAGIMLLSAGPKMYQFADAIDVRIAASNSFTISTTAPVARFEFKEDGKAFAYNLPTSNAGLASGGIYRNGAGANVALMIV